MCDKESDDSDLQSDEERSAIRNELTNLSFEDLQKLKERVGAKVYKEVVFGNKKRVQNENETRDFKRENKNRPREMSSKKPVPVNNLKVAPIKRTAVRDPRFDPLCGEFDKKQFSANYNFLSTVRMNDIKTIKAELKKTTDSDRQLKLRRLLQRLNDQHKTSKRHRTEEEQTDKQKHDIEEQFRLGRQPHFKNKAEQKVESLVKQYEELKKEGTGRIQRHLKRRQQKVKKRSNRVPTGVTELE